MPHIQHKCQHAGWKPAEQAHRLFKRNLPVIPKRAFFSLISGTAVIQPPATAPNSERIFSLVSLLLLAYVLWGVEEFVGLERYL